MNKRFALFEKILICFSFLLLLVQEVNAQTLTKKQMRPYYNDNLDKLCVRKTPPEFD
jgi:hypothetical protein